MAQQKGFLILADISGYTAFLTQAELEHAEDILSNLLQVLLNNLEKTFIVSKLEGDAIFAYAPEGRFTQAQTLLEVVENLYCVFARTIQHMSRNTTCTCKACELIPTLDLKILLHFGTFILSNIGGRQELSGPDVILVHRLLKNEITSATEIDAYLFISQVCVEAIQLEAYVTNMKPHQEHYQHFGDVHGFVHNLHEVWQARQTLDKVVVAEDDIWFSCEAEFPIPPDLLWDYITNPTVRQAYVKADSYTVKGLKQGRTTIGTEQHCEHGQGLTIMTIVDWQPPHYFTAACTMPFSGVMNQTMYVLATPTGSLWRVITSKVHAKNPAMNLFWKFLMIAIKKQVVATIAFGLNKVTEIVNEDIKQKKLTTITFTPTETVLIMAS